MHSVLHLAPRTQYMQTPTLTAHHQHHGAVLDKSEMTSPAVRLMEVNLANACLQIWQSDVSDTCTIKLSLFR